MTNARRHRCRRDGSRVNAAAGLSSGVAARHIGCVQRSNASRSKVAAAVPLDRRGLLAGFGAVLLWAAYNVGSRFAAGQGFIAADLTLLRFGAAGLCAWPILWRLGLRNLAGLGWRRGFVLALLAGPTFGLLMASGFMRAPLAHAIVFAPASTLLSILLGQRLLLGERPQFDQLLGMALLIAASPLPAPTGCATPMTAACWRATCSTAPAASPGGCSPARYGCGTSTRSSPPLPCPGSPCRCSPCCWSRPTGTSWACLGDRSPCNWSCRASAAAFSACCCSASPCAASAPAVPALPASVPAAALLLGIPVLGEGLTMLQVTGVALATLGLLGTIGILRRALRW